MKKEFEIMSSDGVAFYVVSFELDSGKFYVYCDCQAGSRGKWCKHKSQLVLGDLSGLRNSAQSIDIPEILKWVKDSNMGQLLSEIQMAEDEMIKAKARMDKARKNLEKLAREGA
jgi:hypothetical protein